MSGFAVPTDLLYTKEHEWIKVVDEEVLIGITDYAVKSLRDIVFVELPSVGKTVKRGGVISTVESIKAVSEIFSPISGVVLEVNTELEGAPEKISQSPYEEGWIVRVKILDRSELEELMAPEDYRAYLETIAKR